MVEWNDPSISKVGPISCHLSLGGVFSASSLQTSPVTCSAPQTSMPEAEENPSSPLSLLHQPQSLLTPTDHPPAMANQWADPHPFVPKEMH